MRSPDNFIVKPIGGKRYDNTTNIAGVELITSVSEEDHLASNRFAEVIELPIGYKGNIEKGATLIVHHNVMKFYNDMYGQRKSSGSFLKDDLFIVNDEQFFGYNNGNGWEAQGRYCFVKPIPVIDNLSIKKHIDEEPLIGVIKYSNEYLESKGVFAGDKVCFKPESEYPFIVDGEKLYRMFDHQIVIKLN